MAVFEKIPGQDKTGWESSTMTQTIKEGRDTLITLSGYDLGGFYVDVSDSTVCTVHERAIPGATKPIMRRVFVVTGIRDGSCTIRARSSERSASVLATANIVVSNMTMAAKLVFFPGERTKGDVRMGTIYVVGGNGEHYDAAGGAPNAYKDRGGHTSDPTPAGLYVLGEKHHATTGTWPRSAIPYGARLRLLLDGRIEYEVTKNHFAPVNGPQGIVVKYMKQFAARDGLSKSTDECDRELAALVLAPGGKSLRTVFWDLNDFGRWAWNLTQNGKLTPFYVHTTPENEWQVLRGEKVAITNSHGCIHLSPIVRDKMMADGYLKKGTVLEVRKYSDVNPGEL